MSPQSKKILGAALRLPVRDRARMAATLVESLDRHVDEEVEAAWAKELARRARALDSGAAKGVASRTR